MEYMFFFTRTALQVLNLFMTLISFDQNGCPVMMIDVPVSGKECCVGSLLTVLELMLSKDTPFGVCGLLFFFFGWENEVLI